MTKGGPAGDCTQARFGRPQTVLKEFKGPGPRGAGADVPGAVRAGSKTVSGSVKKQGAPNSNFRCCIKERHETGSLITNAEDSIKRNGFDVVFKAEIPLGDSNGICRLK